jgi:hypothetical protein
VIDDGGHTMEQHAASLAVLWRNVRPGGFYAIEDLHTAYDERYRGGNGRATPTTIEWLKDLVDRINGHGEAVPAGGEVGPAGIDDRSAGLEAGSVGPELELADGIAGLWLAQGLAILLKGG